MKELDDLWNDEKNWGRGKLGAYFCKDDPRLVVRKRGLPGGTFNMAHQLAIPLLTVVIIILLGLVIILALFR